MAESRTGFTEYVVARRPRMYRTAWVLCGDSHVAEDLVQQVLTRLYVAWPQLLAAAADERLTLPADLAR